MLRPISNRVCIRKLVEENSEKKYGSLYLPPTSKEKHYEKYEVISVGPGLRGEDGNVIPMSVSPGDVVLVSPYAGKQVVLEGEDLTVVAETLIIAVVE